MYKLDIPPDSDGYTVEHPELIEQTKLVGGYSRYRRTKLGSTYKVTVKWKLDRAEYDKLMNFYYGVTNAGLYPFYMDLILEQNQLKQCVARFVPHTLRTVEQRGLAYVVTAELDVMPDYKRLEALGDYTGTLFDEFGSEYTELFPLAEDVIDILVTTELRNALR